MKTLAFILLSYSSKQQYQKVVGRGVSQFILGERIKHGTGLHDTDYPQIFQVQTCRTGAKVRAKGVHGTEDKWHRKNFLISNSSLG